MTKLLFCLVALFCFNLFSFSCGVLNCFPFVISLFHILSHDILGEWMFWATLYLYRWLQEFFVFCCSKSQHAYTTNIHYHFFVLFYSFFYHPPQHSFSTLIMFHSPLISFVLMFMLSYSWWFFFVVIPLSFLLTICCFSLQVEVQDLNQWYNQHWALFLFLIMFIY